MLAFLFKGIFFTFIITLMSCLPGRKQDNLKTTASSENLSEEEQDLNLRCIEDNFKQGQEENLYGIKCIDNKQLFIKTASDGEEISITDININENKGSLEIEEGIDFLNRYYKLAYEIEDSEDKDFLKRFFPLGEEFFGQKGERYTLIFKVEQNYLVLYKASENLKSIPFSERMVMKTSTTEAGKTLYMVPFIGYPIKYCRAEAIRNNQQEETNQNRAVCKDYSDLKPKNMPYISLDLGSKELFKFFEKNDVFPSSYFEEEEGWYFSKTAVESSKYEEIAISKAYLVKIEFQNDVIQIIEDSGNIKIGANKEVLNDDLEVKWFDYQINKSDDRFYSFGENTSKFAGSNIEKPYVQIKFPEGTTDLVIGPDYFSYTYREVKGKDNLKFKVSLLRAKSIDREGFKPRRWFFEDHEALEDSFGFLPIKPSRSYKTGEISVDDRKSHIRNIKFNTSLSTEEEKKTNTKVIKWYFSKNSTKNTEYREIVREAISIYNQAFKKFTKNSNSKVRVELSEEEKDLGDIRYNIINIIESEKDSNNLLGIAPSFADVETGQIIGATSNILVNKLEEIYFVKVKSYVRYEIFRKDKNTQEENESHVVSKYLRHQIKEKCLDIENFIKNTKAMGVTDPRTDLKDREIIKACSNFILKPYLLHVILHELGHNFSLAHNPACSTDQNNFYLNKEEILKYFPEANEDYIDEDFLPQSSCVMDYMNDEVSHLTVLGKYDLAALRYNYFDEIETKEGGFEKLDINYENPIQQVSLKSKKDEGLKVKEYSYCSDDQQSNRLDCFFWDRGVTYKQRIMNVKMFIEQTFQDRFLYDSETITAKFTPNFNMNIIQVLKHGWLKKLNRASSDNNEIKSIQHAFLSEYAKGYRDIILNINQEKLKEEGLNETADCFFKKCNEYSALYAMLDESYEILKKYFFPKELSCIVEDEFSNTHRIPLYSINKEILKRKSDETFYIVDCYSQNVQNFLIEEKLKLISQDGFDFRNTYDLGKETIRTDILDITRLLTVQFTTKDTTKDKPPLLIKDLFINRIIQLYGPDSLNKLYEEWKTIVKDINFYIPQIQHANKFYFSVPIVYDFFIKKTQSIPDDDIRREHTNEMDFVVHNFVTFSSQVMELLEKQHKPESVLASHPFLQELYKDYKNNDNKKSFWEFLKEQESVYVFEQLLILPNKKDSFFEEVIKTYKKKEKELELLKNKKETEGQTFSFIDNLRYEALENYVNNPRLSLLPFIKQGFVNRKKNK
ncbi:MAG: hypothetical protein GDA46_06285 [Bdellovibrionales bacterium]|nr:hypothetical protein [Bdellovibrionales bacterium]